MPAHYHTNRHHYVVANWHGYGLYEPPHGHHWMLVDGNFVLAAIATGVVAHLLFSH
jgi:Ni/Co efflux regulator RcnB